MMSSCLKLSRFHEIGKKIVALARTYRFRQISDNSSLCIIERASSFPMQQLI